MYQPRTYRQKANNARFHYFNATFRETDLWIGTDHASYRNGMPVFVNGTIAMLRKIIEDFMLQRPSFATTHMPVSPEGWEPVPVQILMRAGAAAGVGPMAAVAGLFSKWIGEALIQHYNPEECVVENGGDIFAFIENPLKMAIHAGDSPLSEKVALNIPPGSWGIGTSSGTVGHSVSYGTADAVTVLDPSPPHADAWATAIANTIRNKSDLQAVARSYENTNRFQALVLIKDDQVAITGDTELVPG